jgi:hypothetical protein
MKTSTFSTSSCRHCRYYRTEGRRGGTCQQLGGLVQAEWKACALAAHPFAHACDKLVGVALLESSFALEFPGNRDFSEEIVAHPAVKSSLPTPSLL